MGNTEYYRKIFAENLNKIMQLRNKTQSDIVNDLGLNKSAVSTWVNGTRLPRMDKVDLLAQYFHVNRSDLIEEKTDNDTSDPYYIDPEVAEIAQAIKDNPGKRALFDATRDVSKEDIEKVLQIINVITKDD